MTFYPFSTANTYGISHRLIYLTSPTSDMFVLSVLSFELEFHFFFSCVRHMNLIPLYRTWFSQPAIECAIINRNGESLSLCHINSNHSSVLLRKRQRFYSSREISPIDAYRNTSFYGRNPNLYSFFFVSSVPNVFH